MSSIASLIASVKSNTANNSMVQKSLAANKKRQKASESRGVQPVKKAKVAAGKGSAAKASTSGPQVVVFDGSALTARPVVESKAAKKAFLAGKANIEDIPANDNNAALDDEEGSDNENENIRKDKELKDLLATSRLLEEYQVDEMSGKERRKHMMGKMEQLGMKAAKQEKRPLEMRLGMMSKDKERQQKKLQEAKDVGLYDKSLRHLYVKTKKKERQRDPGVTGGVGKMKGATLTISKHELSRLTKSSSSSSKGGRKK
ncbi:hypothetical protein BC940DRAFT_297732 [Gongronella butleri]|nr:hypothetical protein BC940DRAFT_297732 [Gongronella butleri]